MPGEWDDVREALEAAEDAVRPADRFALAHLAALRVAAWAMTGRPRRRGSLRHGGVPRSIWEVLPEVAPELGEWAAFFGGLQLKRQAVHAGASALVTEREADDLVRDAQAFAAAAEQIPAGTRGFRRRVERGAG